MKEENGISSLVRAESLGFILEEGTQAKVWLVFLLGYSDFIVSDELLVSQASAFF